MIYIYFSYAADAAALRLSVASLRRHDPSATIWVANDAAALITADDLPPDVQELRTNYRRGGTGTGLEAVAGQLDVFRIVMEAEHVDHVVKIDSDIFVARHWEGFEPGKNERCPVEADMLACEGARALLPMGGIYRISRHAVRWCTAYLAQRKHWQPGTYAEALTLWHMLTLSPLRLCLLPADAHVLGGFDVSGSKGGRGCYIHAGEPHVEGGKLTRATRELTYTRMRLLHELHAR